MGSDDKVVTQSPTTTTVPADDYTSLDQTQAGNKKVKTTVKKVYQIDANGEQLLPNGNTLFWHRGLLAQIPKVGSCYLDWTNHSTSRRVRMFDSDFLEGCSMTFWWIVPCLYIPWSMLELRDSYRYFTDIEFFYRKHNLDINNNIDNINDYILNSITPAWNPLVLYFNIPVILSCIIYFIIGLIIWTLFEYVAHRFLFHWEPPLELKYFNADRLNVISFLVHGMHHLIPTDELRLVFPPAINYTWINNTYIIYTLFISNWFIKCISCWFSIWISII